MRTISLLLVLSVTVLRPSPPALAQERSAAEGVLYVTDRPEEDARALRRYDILPAIDSLLVGYRYEVRGGKPFLSLALEWMPGTWGILDGRRVPFEALPDSIAITSLAVRAQVYSERRRVTEVVFQSDTLNLLASPDLYHTEEKLITWVSVFQNTPPRAARKLMERGFELRDPELLAVTFESYDAVEGRSIAQHVQTGRRSPSRRAVYVPASAADVLIDLAWIFRPRPWEIRGDARADEDDRPRGRDKGRSGGEHGKDQGSRGSERGGHADNVDGASSGEVRKNGAPSTVADGETPSKRGRSSSESNEESSDSDEVDDDAKLLPVALTAAAAVGILAYKAGTVGYYGNAEHAPYGVAAGLVRRSGGVLVQAAASEAALGSGSGPEHLLAKVLAFRRVLPIPIQPAVGAGVLVEHSGEAISYRPSLSAGLLGNFSPVVLLGAYDVALGGWELGAAFNFRSKR